MLVGCQLLFFIATVCYYYLSVLKYIDLVTKIAINAGMAIKTNKPNTNKNCSLSA